MRFASAGDAPAVEIAIASGPVRTIAGRMKLHSGGTSTTVTSIRRPPASSQTLMFQSLARGAHERHEHRAPLGVVVDADVHIRVAGRRDHHEDALQIRGSGVGALLPA